MGHEHGFPRGVVAHEDLAQLVMALRVRCLDLERYIGLRLIAFLLLLVASLLHDKT